MTLFLSLLLTCLAAGCDEFSADGQAVRDTWKAYWDAVDSGNSAEACKHLSAASMDRYKNLIHRALDATPTETKMLSPMDQMEVLVMRCALTRAELQKMDGPAFVKRAIEDGWWSTTRAHSEIENIKIRKDVATADRVRGKVRLDVEFVREDGLWKIDVPAGDRSISDRFSELAADAGVTESDLILMTIERKFGPQREEKLFQPMR